MRSIFEFKDRIIHVWPVRTIASKDLITWFDGVLDPQERLRASRFRFDNHRRSFVVAHGALRTLLASYLKTSASNIQFEYGYNGKPGLSGSAVTFNMSHSGDMAVFAFTDGCEIGIDVEEIRPMEDMDQIAAHFFCPDEAAELQRMPANERERGFFLCWTRKEAYIKAIGDGLSVPLNDFRVTLQAGEARFVHLAGDTAAANEWMLHDLRLAPAYAAALAYRDQERTVNVLPLVDAAKLPGL